VPAGLPKLAISTLEALQVRYLPRITDLGFEVRPIPEGLHRLLSGLLALRSGRAVPEDADRNYHLGDDPEIVPIDDVADEILRYLQPLHEAWCGVPLLPSAAYGLRRYRSGNRMGMHVDRLDTHIVSSVLQIAQDVDEPWPIQLERDGRREDVLLSAGQMLLYEGAATPHGRVTPLVGRDFVNLFVHYRPVAWSWSLEVLSRQALADGVIDRLGRVRS
jgi:prolyl 4-hydroxylase